MQAQTAHFIGIQSTVATTTLSSPHALSVDLTGNLVISDSSNFRVLKETPVAGGGFSETVLYSGNSSIESAASDASGNVYVADTMNNQVLKETLSGGAYTQSVIGAGLDYPESVAVDASGNVYIADSHNDRVLKETLSGGTYTESIVESGMFLPIALALSASGNLYVADYTDSLVLLETLQGNGTYVQTTIPTTGLSGPTGVAVDAAGDVLVVDFGHKRVLKETLIAGSYTQSVLGTGMAQPYGVAVDASGNVYVSDETNNSVLLETTGAGNFGSVAVAATSAAMALIFSFDMAGTLGGVPYVVSTEVAAGLDFTDAGGGSCLANAAYVVGATCTVNVKFTPSLSGARYGGVSLQGGANTPIASGYLTGTGSGPQLNYLPYTQSVVASGLNNPRALAVDESGDLYIVDTDNMRVLQETPAGSSYTQSLFPTTALYWPLSAAVGGNGNLYLADTYHSRILNEVWTGTGYIEHVVTSTGLDYPSGVGVDAAGNVYIADRGNGGSDLGHIYKETLTGTNTYVRSTLPFVGLSGPQRVCLDAVGNLYVASTGNNLIFKASIAGGVFTQSTIATSPLNHPNLSVDPWGNLYIADVNNNRVLKETVAGAGYTESLVGTGLYSPNDAVGDAWGNVFIADTSHSRVLKLDYADPPGLTFPSTYAGTTSSAQTVTVTNIGSAPLFLPIPTTGMNPSIAANFVWNTMGTSACPILSTSSSSAATLAAGASCLLSISFSPTAIGSITGTMVLQDNALNAASTFQTISLGGTGLSPDPTQMNLTVTPNPVTIFNKSTITATVSDSLNPSSIPTGTLTLSDTLNGTTTALNQGAGFFLTGGSAIYAVPLTGVGAHTITATSTATNVFASSTSQATVVVAAAIPVLSFASIPSQTYGNAAFAVNASSASTGSVLYTVISGPASISGSTVTITGAGTISLAATQGADANYTTATATTSFTVSPAMPVLSFASIPSQTYGNAAFALNATSASTGAILYTVSSGPATISGSTVTITGEGTVTLQASQAATANYSAATAATSFTVNPAMPLLSFAPIPSQTYGNAAFAVSATSASSGSIAYTVSSGPATISGSTVTVTGAGTVTLAATQTAATNYATATATTSFTVEPAVPILSFTAIPPQTYGNQAISIRATSPSDGAITNAVSSGPATLTGSTLTITGAGVVNLIAVQAATPNYAAVTTTTSFTVEPATPTLTFASIPPQAYGNSPFPVTAVSPSGGPVTYAISSGPATISGATVTLRGAGWVTVTSTVVATGNYTAATATTSFAVHAASTNLVISTSSPAVLIDNPVVFTSTVTSPAGPPDGTVIFLDEGVSIGAAVLSNGSATLTSSFQTLGGHSVTATYEGSQNFVPASANVLTLNVLDFLLNNVGDGGVAPPPIRRGAAHTYTLALVPTSGNSIPATITLSLNGLPAGATAQIASPLWARLTSASWSLPANTPVSNISLTVQLPVQVSSSDPAAPWKRIRTSFCWGFLLLPFSLPLRGKRRRIARLRSLVFFLTVGTTLVAGLSGCGSNAYIVQPQVSYPLTITADCGSFTRAVELTLTVN